MIKALLLIFSAPATWTRIAETRRSWGLVFVLYLLPTVVLACAAEGYGLVHWGKARGEMPRLTQFSPKFAVSYEIAQGLLSVGIVFLIGGLIKSLGGTFHGRHTFSQTFTVAAYGLAPLFLLRLLDAFPGLPAWLTWAVGAVLCVAVLYSGIPLVMRPDPPHALGLYLMTALFILIVTGLARFVTAWYLMGRFGKLDALIGKLAH